MSGFNTSLLHDGVDDYPNGATLVPIYQSSAFKHESAELSLIHISEPTRPY